MADEGLLIPIQFTLEEARAALAQLEAQARAAGQRTGSGISDGVGKGLSGLKTGMSQGREITMALTGALGELGPAGRTAQLALSSVGSLMLGGGLLGAGLMAAQAGVRLLVDAWEEEARASKAAADAAREAAAVRSAANRELMAQANGSISSLQGMVASLRDTTAAEKAHQEVLKINQQLALAQDPAFRRTLELRLAEAKALETLIGRLEAEKAAREASAKALAAQLALQQAQDARNRTAILAGETAWMEERERLRVEHERTMEGLSTPEAKQAENERYWAADLAIMQRASAAKRAAKEQSDAEIKALTDASTKSDLDKLQADADAAKAIEDKRNAERIRREQETTQAIQAIAVQAGQMMLSGLADSLIHADLVNRRYAAQYSALAGAQRAQMLLQRGTAKSLAEAQVMVAQEAGAAKAAEAAATKAAESEKLKAMAIGWALQGAVMAIPGPQFNPAAAAVYLGAAVAAGTAASVLASQATGMAQGRGLTAQENDNLANLRGGSGVSVGGAREYGGGAGTGGTVTVRETIYVGVVANDFESPAETARRAARVMALAEQLDLTKRADA